MLVCLYILQGCEREVAEAEKGSSDELKSECIMRLSWALVHSKRPEDVQRGIAMLEGILWISMCMCVAVLGYSTVIKGSLECFCALDFRTLIALSFYHAYIPLSGCQSKLQFCG